MLLSNSPTAGLRALVAAGLLVLAGCKGRGTARPSVGPVPGETVTQTPATDASELDEGLRVRFLRLVAAGDEAFAEDDDVAAIKSWTAALELVADEASDELRDSVLARVVVAHARGGGAELALSLYEQLAPELRGGAPLRFDRARALDRSKASPDLALAAWFEAWAAAAETENAAGTAYARLRAEQLWSGLAGTTTELLDHVGSENARTCAAHFTRGDRPPADAPTWTASCLPGQRDARGAPVIGVLLPRSGKFAALADVHLATLSTAMRLTTPDQAQLRLVFRDAGSATDTAVEGAQALVDAGVSVIVGPIGAKQTRAVMEAVGGRARVINPGPPAGGSEGVAPTLEDRVAALAKTGLDRGCQGAWTVMHAQGGYGQRGLRHFKALAKQSEFKALGQGGGPKVLEYSAAETSFAKLLRSAPGAFGAKRCVLVIDTLSRTSAIARQLRREGSTFDDGGLRFMSTAEGLDARALAGEAMLAGSFVAPVALPEPRSTFQDSYALATGRAADDQALLLWAALRRAVWKDDGGGASARVARFDDGGSLDVSTQR